MSDESENDYYSDSSDEDIDFEALLNIPRVKNEDYLEETVPQYNDDLFFEHFRVSREVAHNIATRYETSELYKRHSGQYGKLSALNQTLIFLWYMGHQTSSFRDVADRFNVTISTLHRVIRRLTIFLSNLSLQFIKWPTENEKREIEAHFRENGFPGVIGVIDGCHIKIDKPKYDPESYINRKSYYSVQMQAVCDHNKRITDIHIGYPGSVHDSRVFRNSPLCRSLNEKCGRYHLLGDSGYPLLTKLMVPFKDRGHLTQRQINFNRKLSKNRVKIEHCFGILKQKFRQLYHIKLRNITYIVHLIRAACVLHNIAIQDEFPIEEEFGGEEVLPQVGDINDDDGEEDDDENENDDAKEIRNNIMNNLIM